MDQRSDTRVGPSKKQCILLEESSDEEDSLQNIEHKVDQTKEKNMKTEAKGLHDNDMIPQLSLVVLILMLFFKIFFSIL